ncbi:MAG: hypothetical protein QF580_02240 [Gammaproteobacteria bacterium]|jgi:hypothetical protein|nr:hypothetical protein [Gammaproteobacteria bacterium]
MVGLLFRDGRGMWIKLLEATGNTYETIPGRGGGCLLEGDDEKNFAAIIRAELDAIHGN